MDETNKKQLIADQVRTALMPFGVQPSGQQIDLIRSYTNLLMKWNRSISLTTVADPVEIVARHFGESMFASCAIPVEKCRLADVGTGAGFPGVALKVLSPTLKLWLVESNRKKCAFLAEVIRELGMKDVEIVHARFEEVREFSAPLDFVTARALGGFPKLLKWASEVLSERGNMILWLGLEDVNTVSANATWLWQPAIKIPESQRRYLLAGRPNRNK